MDAVAEILRSLRLASSVWCRAEFSAPWAVHTRGARGAIFHAVVSGRAFGKRGDDQVELEGGDLVLFSRGDAHVMSDRPLRKPVPIRSLVAQGEDRCVGAIRHGGGGAQTVIICGAFDLEHGARDLLLGLLPPVLHVRRDAGLVRWFDQTLSLMQAELDADRPGAETVVAKLADVLFVQILRASVAELPSGAGGWLAALRDPPIARALAKIHQSPAERWSVEALAEVAHLSRSAFCGRFAKLVGESPAQYLTRWRMYTAVDLLKRRGDLGNAELAAMVGYDSEDAFARAFKRHLGFTPRDARARSA